ncbi:MAG TPA: hypothetical protein VFT74_16085, partial [Isosphaeraceae bacterium]|nr:hypothetical protein [Isosphaeraceae bacterium]
MSRLRSIGKLGCIIALVSTGCAGPQHRTAQTAILPWDEVADKEVHGPNDPFMPQPQPAFGLGRYFPRLARTAQARRPSGLDATERPPIGLPRSPARIDGPEPLRQDGGLAGDFDLQARADAPRLPVTMLAPVNPQSVADAELDVNSDGVLDRRRPPFRAKDDRAARLVQARGQDLQDGPTDPFGNLDRFDPPQAVAWPEPASQTTPAEAAPAVSSASMPSQVPATAAPGGWNPTTSPGAEDDGFDSRAGERTSAAEPTKHPEPMDASDPFADLRLPPIPMEATRSEAQPMTVSAPSEATLALPVAESEAAVEPQPQPAVEETFTQDVGSASDPFAGLKLPPPPMDANLFEPVPEGRPRLDPSKLGGSSMYAPSVRRMVADSEEYDRSGLSGRPRVPQSATEMGLPPATFPPTYYETGAQQVGPGPEARPPVPQPEAEPTGHRR